MQLLTWANVTIDISIIHPYAKFWPIILKSFLRMFDWSSMSSRLDSAPAIDVDNHIMREPYNPAKATIFKWQIIFCWKEQLLIWAYVLNDISIICLYVEFWSIILRSFLRMFDWSLMLSRLDSAPAIDVDDSIILESL